MVDSIKDTKGIDELLDAMAAAEATSEATRNAPRPNGRYPWRTRTYVRVNHPGGSISTLEVVGRSISESDAVFLCDGFLNPGTACRLLIRRLDKSWINMGTVIRSCRYLHGHLHEASVAFTQSIDLNQVIREQMCGRILLVDDAQDFARLTRAHLAKTGLELVLCSSGVEALGLTAMGGFDLVIMDVEMPGMTGPQTARMMRERGFVRPIIALSANDLSATREACLEAGYNEFLAKPVRPHELAAVVRRYMSGNTPIVSTYADNAEMVDFLQEFVATLPQRVQEMISALQAWDCHTLLRLTRALKAIASSSGGCGFDVISEVAQKAESLLVQADTDWAAVGRVISDLDALSRRVRVARNP